MKRKARLSDKIYRDPKWRILRMKVFAESEFRCQICGFRGALELDHIRPMWKGGDAFNRSNLQAVCRDCHIQKTKREFMSPDRLKWVDYLAEEIRQIDSIPEE